MHHSAHMHSPQTPNWPASGTHACSRPTASIHQETHLTSKPSCFCTRENGGVSTPMRPKILAMFALNWIGWGWREGRSVSGVGRSNPWASFATEGECLGLTAPRHGVLAAHAASGSRCHALRAATSRWRHAAPRCVPSERVSSMASLSFKWCFSPHYTHMQSCRRWP